MKAIEALEIVNRKGTDNSEYGIIKDWGERLNDSFAGRSTSSLVSELFGESAEIIERSYEIGDVFKVESILYAYRDWDNTHDFACLGEMPMLTIYIHDGKDTIDVYELV